MILGTTFGKQLRSYILDSWYLLGMWWLTLRRSLRRLTLKIWITSRMQSHFLLTSLLSLSASLSSCTKASKVLCPTPKVQEALRTRGLKDDTTCIVVDIIPPDTAMPPPSPPRKRPSKFSLRSLFFRKNSHGSASKLSKKLSAVGIVEELFEEGSAMLSERLGNDETCGPSTSGLFMCAVCQVDLGTSEGISVHAGSIFSTSSKPWEGPFLCADCRNKKDAMEGKRPSGVKVT